MRVEIMIDKEQKFSFTETCALCIPKPRTAFEKVAPMASS